MTVSTTKQHVMTIPTAGRTYLNLGKHASYAAAHAGQIPTIRVGRKFLVPVAAMERMLETGVQPTPPKAA
jgi:excisionase family DNA binding protein